MSLDLPMLRWNQLRDIVSLTGSWLQVKSNGIYSVDKAEAKSTLSIPDFIAHTFGYGPFGNHTITSFIEQRAHDHFQDCSTNLLEHIKYCRQQIKPADFPETLNLIPPTMQQMTAILEDKNEMLQQIRSKFFHQKDYFGKTCLTISIFLRALKRPDWLTIDRIKHAFGYGPLGLHTLQKLIQEAARNCIDQLIQPHLKKLQQAELEATDHSLIEIVDQVESIRENTQPLLKTFERYFWEKSTLLGKCCLFVSSVFEKIRSLFQKKVAPLELPFKSSHDLCQKLLTQEPILLLQTSIDQKTLIFCLKTTPRCHQITLHRENKQIGIFVFRRDSIEKNSRPTLVLSITEWNIEPQNDASLNVLSKLLYNLQQLSGTAEMTYDPDVTPLPSPQPLVLAAATRPSTGNDKARCFQRIRERFPHKSLFPNLLDIETIIKATMFR